jgi:hydroxymethylbilane synthase
VLRIGTRGSRLALAQAEIVRGQLLDIQPDLRLELTELTTKGDLLQDRPLVEIGGNGLFATQIEVALREGEVDMAVHSAKDLPSIIAPDLALAAFLPRADPRDVLISVSGKSLGELPVGARIGTSSPRRAVQIAALRPDVELLDIRGNVDTRLRKLQEGGYDAIVLAAAGLARLGLLDQVTEWLDSKKLLPAVGQGALAVEVRAGDGEMLRLASMLDDADTSVAVLAERAFLARIGASCTLPVAAFGRVDGGRLHFEAMIADEAGRIVRGARDVERARGPAVGVELADELRVRLGQSAGAS